MTTKTVKVVARGEQELVISREFDAPRTMVWDAYTKPELLKRWLLGPPGWVLSTCEVDLRVGGRFRWVWTGERGTMGMSGEYREIVHPERIVNTERFDDPWYPGEAVGTLVFTERNGRTLLEETVRYESRAARDGVLASPMADGLNASYDRLDGLLAEGAAH
jgi:uncharacterized protein YndB with AHSA1/START domain